jgi:hypothetical protein
MLKTISAALLAVSVIAAPAMAASFDKTAQAPAAKTGQAPKAKQLKPNALNANAKMGDHHRHFHHHHRSHRHMSALKTHKISKVTIKHPGPAIKRG